MTSYRPGHTVHWIQARKAAEDSESWQEAFVCWAGERYLIVGIPGEPAVVLRNRQVPPELLEASPAAPIRVQVSLRWHLLRHAGRLLSVAGPD